MVLSTKHWRVIVKASLYPAQLFSFRQVVFFESASGKPNVSLLPLPTRVRVQEEILVHMCSRRSLVFVPLANEPRFRDMYGPT